MKLRAGFLKKTDKPLARLPKEKKINSEMKGEIIQLI